MDLAQYREYLQSKGANHGDVVRNQSNMIMNATFTYDPAYKKVYILAPNADNDNVVEWHFVDAKYQKHADQSISQNNVDYYLQFRPNQHYAIGTYVIIPDDTSPMVNLTEDELADPFTQPIKNRTEWWIIVGRTEDNISVRYMILKCNWEFKWIYNNKIQTCWGCSRNANSYTSGFWTDEYSTSLDDLTGAWLPDTHYTYGDQLSELGLCDTRTVMYLQRFIISINDLDPKVYQVTKVNDVSPQGVIKLSLKQDEFNKSRDSVEYHICDFYGDNGQPKVGTDNTDDSETVIIISVDSDLHSLVPPITQVQLGGKYFFAHNLTEDMLWKVDFPSVASARKESFAKLINITKIADNACSISVQSSSALRGKTFNLQVVDMSGAVRTEYALEVI